MAEGAHTHGGHTHGGLTQGGATQGGGVTAQAQTLGAAHGQALLAAIIARIREAQDEHDAAIAHELGAM